MPRSKEAKRRPNGSGRIYKQNGVYYLQYRLADGKRKSITLHNECGEKIADLREAEKAAKLFLEPLHKINEIKSREEYLQEKAKLKKLAARAIIRLEDAFQLFLEKPRSAVPQKCHVNVIKSRWDDFTAFAKAKYHLTHIAEVEPKHADAYIAFVRQNGRFCKKTHHGKTYEQARDTKMSSATANQYLRACRQVFKHLLPDLGLTSDENPFQHIQGIIVKHVSREIFTQDELALIFADPPPLMKAMFTIGLCTGLREGDVATLKWNEISGYKNGTNVSDFLYHEINRVTRKTHTLVHIPVEFELAQCFAELAGQRNIGSPFAEYVIPQAAEMYLYHPGTLSHAIHKYLKDLGIATQRKTTGGKRNQSVKDFHSLRHCFCYYAGIKGVPLPVIQSIVGHLNPEMTRHYQDHADREARLKGISMMRGMVHTQAENSTLGMMRQRLRELAGIGSEQLIVKLNLYADKLLKEEKSGIISISEVKMLPEVEK